MINLEVINMLIFKMVFCIKLLILFETRERFPTILQLTLAKQLPLNSDNLAEVFSTKRTWPEKIPKNYIKITEHHFESLKLQV